MYLCPRTTQPGRTLPEREHLLGSDVVPTFADLLRRYRRAAGLTQGELAERAGLSVRGIADLERGARIAPRRDTLALLAQALDLEGDERAAFVKAGRRPA